MARSIEECPGFEKLTEFQKKIVEYLIKQGDGYVSSGTWSVAAGVAPDRWRKPAARGVMVAHVRRSAYGMTDFVGVLPAKDRWDQARLFLLDRVRKFINGEGQA